MKLIKEAFSNAESLFTSVAGKEEVSNQLRLDLNDINYLFIP